MAYWADCMLCVAAAGSLDYGGGQPRAAGVDRTDRPVRENGSGLYFRHIVGYNVYRRLRGTSFGFALRSADGSIGQNCDVAHER
jgi:hypothetical protein